MQKQEALAAAAEARSSTRPLTWRSRNGIAAFTWSGLGLGARVGIGAGAGVGVGVYRQRGGGGASEECTDDRLGEGVGVLVSS